MGEHDLESQTPLQSRLAALQARVNSVARALHGQGIRPTVARVRAALGGGSPNELTPALRRWRDEVMPTLQPLPGEKLAPPPQIADLARELWTRAVAAAQIDKRGGEVAIQQVARSEEASSLRQQVSALRDQLEREALAYGELRARAARHEAIAKEALGRIREVEERERKALHQLGDAKQRIALLAARSRQPIARARAPTTAPRGITAITKLRSAATKARGIGAGKGGKKSAVTRRRPKSRRRR